MQFLSVDVFLNERHERCQKTIGKRFFVNTVQYGFGCQVVFVQKSLFEGGGQLIFQYIPHKYFPQHSAAAFVADNKPEWRYIIFYLISVVIA